MVLVASGIIAATVWSSRTTVRSAQADAVAATAAPNGAADIALTAATNAGTHPVYRYSVVPGGVHTQEDVSKAIAGDAVVANHYQNVDPKRLRVEKLATDRLAYVSYRKGDQVYWTKRPVRIPAGDTVLTDGQSTIRARCGNCLSTAPMLPTAPDEPETVAFDALVDAPPPAQSAGLIPSRNLTFGGAPGFNGAPAGGALGGGTTGGSGGGVGGGVPGGGATVGGFGSGGGGVVTTRSTPGSGSSGPSTGPGGNPGPGGPPNVEQPGGPPGLTSHNEGNPPPGDDNPPSDDPPKFTPPRDPPTPKSDDPPANDPPSGDDPPINPTDVPGDDPPDVPSVPEPVSLLLLGTGVSGFVLRRVAQRRQRRSSEQR